MSNSETLTTVIKNLKKYKFKSIEIPNKAHVNFKNIENMLIEFNADDITLKINNIEIIISHKDITGFINSHDGLALLLGKNAEDWILLNKIDGRY